MSSEASRAIDILLVEDSPEDVDLTRIVLERSESHKQVVRACIARLPLVTARPAPACRHDRILHQSVTKRDRVHGVLARVKSKSLQWADRKRVVRKLQRIHHIILS